MFKASIQISRQNPHGHRVTWHKRKKWRDVLLCALCTPWDEARYITAIWCTNCPNACAFSVALEATNTVSGDGYENIQALNHNAFMYCEMCPSHKGICSKIYKKNKNHKPSILTSQNPCCVSPKAKSDFKEKPLRDGRYSWSPLHGQSFWGIQDAVEPRSPRQALNLVSWSSQTHKPSNQTTQQQQVWYV